MQRLSLTECFPLPVMGLNISLAVKVDVSIFEVNDCQKPCLQVFLIGQ